MKKYNFDFNNNWHGPEFNFVKLGFWFGYDYTQFFIELLGFEFCFTYNSHEAIKLDKFLNKLEDYEQKLDKEIKEDMAELSKSFNEFVDSVDVDFNVAAGKPSKASKTTKKSSSKKAAKKAINKAKVAAKRKTTK